MKTGRTQAPEVVQSLEDAGCDKKTIAQFLFLQAEGRQEACFRLLAKHRQKLLVTMHKDQKRIDVLDYLIYQIKKDGKGQNV